MALTDTESVIDLIDQQRYPIHDPGNQKRAALVERCRTDLRQNALCFLPGFLREHAVSLLANEIQAMSAQALGNDHLRTAYSWLDNRGFGPDHPRSMLFRRKFKYIITDQIAEQAMIKALFMWQPLTDFVRDALGFKSLYRSTCPTQSIQLNIMDEGDVLPWHFDTNDGVVSLLVEQADDGGEFQLAPYVRSEDNENYEMVMQAMQADPRVIVEPRMPAGTLILFNGRRSLHRVSPVGKTRKPRSIVLYSYDEQQDMKFPKKTQDRLRYPDPSPYKGAGTPETASGFIDWETGESV